MGLDKKVFIMGLIEEFKDYASDSIDEGHDEIFPDHFDFLMQCLNDFAEDKNAK